MTSSNDRIDPVILYSMESTSPTYRITTQSGTIVGNDLTWSSPAIQLHEGALSRFDKHPKDLDPGESSIVSYPLLSDSLVCRVTRTDGYVPIASQGPIEFVEPDPVPKKEKRNAIAEGLDAHYAKEEPVKVRRGRGKGAVS